MRAYKITTEGGKLKGRLILNDEQEKLPIADDTNYRETVLECHKVLDQFGIAPVEEGPCSLKDPECQSHLGHRVRELVDRCADAETKLKKVAEAIADPERILEILEFRVKRH